MPAKYAANREQPDIRRHRLDEIVDRQTHQGDENDGAPAIAVGKRAQDGREYELHRRVKRAQNAVNVGRLRRIAADELLDQARQNGKRQPDTEHVDDNDRQNENQTGFAHALPQF